MDKRRFLKAIGMTSVASLLAAPFFARSSASSTQAQDDSSLEERFTQLKNQFVVLQDKLAKEIRDREAAVDVLSNSFIGSVVAIPYASLDDVPPDWHLCDGTAFEPGEYPKLQELGMDCFPDYRGVFLRGLDEGVGKDPGRGINTFQDSENKAHRHNGQTGAAGGHDHGGSTVVDTFDFGDPATGSIGGVKRTDSCCDSAIQLEYQRTTPHLSLACPPALTPWSPTRNHRRTRPSSFYYLRRRFRIPTAEHVRSLYHQIRLI